MLPSSTTKSPPHLHQDLTERKETNLGPPETCRRSPARNPSHGAGWGCKRAVEAGSRESGRRRGRRRPRGARGRAARHRSSPEAGGVGAGGGEDFLGREGEEAPVLCVWSERGLNTPNCRAFFARTKRFHKLATLKKDCGLNNGKP